MKQLDVLTRQFFIFLITVYRIVLSPAMQFLAASTGMASHCKFPESCSQYAVNALRQRPLLTALKLSAKRLLKCHPWGETSKKEFSL